MNTQANGSNCGGCNITCKTLELCNAGTCSSVCSAGQTGCAGDGGPGFCAKLATDNLNCGACGKLCGDLEVCISGACKAACIQGQTACIPDGGLLQPDGAPLAPFCTDTSSDNAHCGACFNACPFAKPLCVSGTCYSLDAGPG